MARKLGWGRRRSGGGLVVGLVVCLVSCCTINYGLLCVGCVFVGWVLSGLGCEASFRSFYAWW